MLVQVHAELLDTFQDILPAHVRGEGLLFHLFADAFGLEALEALWPDESAGGYEAGELVHGVEGLREERFARHTQVVGVTFYGFQHVFGVAPARELSDARHRVLRRRGVLL